MNVSIYSSRSIFMFSFISVSTSISNLVSLFRFDLPTVFLFYIYNIYIYIAPNALSELGQRALFSNVFV